MTPKPVRMRNPTTPKPTTNGTISICALPNAPDGLVGLLFLRHDEEHVLDLVVIEDQCVRSLAEPVGLAAAHLDDDAGAAVLDLALAEAIGDLRGRDATEHP